MSDVTKELGINLHDYQIYAKNFIKNTNKCGLFFDMGLGKTLITLSAFYELWQEHRLNGHILVVAPLEIAKSTWLEEIRKWNFPFRTKSLVLNDKGKKLTKAKRDEIITDIPNQPFPTIYFINREMVEYLVDNPPVVNGDYVWFFQNIIIDELQSFKSYNSNRFKALQYLTKPLPNGAPNPCIERLVGLTGTPTPNGLEDLWSEIYLMDAGHRLGPNITAYRNKWFVPGLMVHNHPVNYRPIVGAEEDIFNRINDIVISVKNPNLNLPPVTFNNFTVYMDDKARKKYDKLKKDKVIGTLNVKKIEAGNAAVLQAKLSQMASGALYTNAQTHEYEVIHEAKLDALQYIMDNTGSPIIVAYHFQSDRDMILKRFPGVAQVYDASIKDAWNKGEIPMMLIQPRSAGFGLNLQDGGHNLVWYTLPWSLEEYLQTNGRVYRQGQKHPTVIHHLMTDKTVDKRILKAIELKDFTEQALLDAVAAELDN